MVVDWSTATFELEAAPEPGGHPRNSFNLDVLFVRANFFFKKDAPDMKNQKLENRKWQDDRQHFLFITNTVPSFFV